MPLTINAQDIAFRLMHTNDLHSHLEGSWQLDQNNTPVRLGHYSRLLSEISKAKSEAKANGQETVLLDAGDFFAGTVYHTLGPWSEVEEFPEWEYFTRAGYDAVTLGNHEFDPGNVGLATMLSKIKKGPKIVSSNILIPKEFNREKIFDYAIKEISYKERRIKIGILGILGPDGCLVSKASREAIRFTGFSDGDSSAQWGELVEDLQRKIDILKKQVQVVILIMHAGNPEDSKLAEALKGVDLIVAGHTHRVYGHYIAGTPISQAGEFGSHLGLLDLSYNIEKKALTVITPKNSWIKEIRSEGTRDIKFDQRIKYFKKLSKKRLGAMIPDYDQIIFTPKRDYLRAREINNELGSFITSSIKSSINDLRPTSQIDLYFTSMGLIRSSFYKDIPYTFPDIFEILSVGFARDGKPGSEITIFKLSPNDVEKVVGFMELYSHFSSSFAPAFSDSVQFKVRSWGIPFVNRIYDLKINGVAIGQIEKPITVSTNMIVAKNIDLIGQKTYGLINIEPLNLQGEAQTPKPTTLPKEFELLTNHLLKNKN